MDREANVTKLQPGVSGYEGKAKELHGAVKARAGAGGEETPAARVARQIIERRKEAAMANKCSKCGEPGHNATTCGKAKATKETKPRARRASKKRTGRGVAVVHVPPEAPSANQVLAAPAVALTIIKEGHRLMDRLERFFGKPDS